MPTPTLALIPRNQPIELRTPVTSTSSAASTVVTVSSVNESKRKKVCLEGYASLTLAECGQFVARALPELPVAKGRSGRPVELSRASAEEKGVGGARSLPS